MVSLAGLSAVYPGELQAEGQSQQNDMRKMQLDQAQAEIAGKQALGKVFQQMVPGAQAGGPPPPQQQMAPQAPPPGQSSQPMQPPQPPPQQPPGPAAGGARGPQPGMPPGAPPGGAQPPGPPGGQPGGGGGAPQGQGQFDLKTAAAAIAKANPGIQPRVLVEALTAALPYLNAEAKEAVAQMRVQMQQEMNDIRRDSIDSRERMLQTRESGLDRRLETTEGGRNQRSDTAAETRRYSADRSLEGKKYTADTLLQARELSNEARKEIAVLSNETRKEIADRAEVGKTNRAELSANTRRELLTMSLETRRELTSMMEEGRDRRQEVGEAGKADRQGVAEEGRNKRLDTQESGRDRRTDVTETGRNTRSAAGIASREKITEERLDFGDRWKGVQREQHEQDRTSREDIAKANRESREGIAEKRLDLSTAREARLAQSGADRLKQQQATLEQRKKEAEARIAKGDRTGQLAELMAVAKAQHTLDMEIISSYSFNTRLKPAEREKLVKEATQHRDDELAQIKSMAKLGGGMTGAADQPPPEAIKQLKEGTATTFENGQKWTLRNGKPEKVQ